MISFQGVLLDGLCYLLGASDKYIILNLVLNFSSFICMEYFFIVPQIILRERERELIFSCLIYFFLNLIDLLLRYESIDERMSQGNFLW